jgi:hypothetical protein
MPFSPLLIIRLPPSHGWLSAAGGHRAASVAEKEVGNIVTAVVRVHECASENVPH